MPFELVLSSTHTLTLQHVDTKVMFQVPMDSLVSSASVLKALNDAWESWKETK